MRTQTRTLIDRATTQGASAPHPLVTVSAISSAWINPRMPMVVTTARHTETAGTGATIPSLHTEMMASSTAVIRHAPDRGSSAPRITASALWMTVEGKSITAEE